MQLWVRGPVHGLQLFAAPSWPDAVWERMNFVKALSVANVLLGEAIQAI